MRVYFWRKREEAGLGWRDERAVAASPVLFAAIRRRTKKKREEVRLAVGKTFTFSYDAPPAAAPPPPPTTDAQPDQRRRKKSSFGGKRIARVTRNRHCRLSFPLSTHVPLPNRNAWKKEATKQFLVS